MSDFAASMFVLAGFWLAVLAVLGIISLVLSKIGEDEDDESR